MSERAADVNFDPIRSVTLKSLCVRSSCDNRRWMPCPKLWSVITLQTTESDADDPSRE